MKRELSYDTDNIMEMMNALKTVLLDIDAVNIMGSSSDRNVSSFVNLKNLIRIVKSSKTYKFVFTDYEKLLDARPARRILGKEEMRYFVPLNRRDVINPAYIEMMDERGVHLKGQKEPIKVSRSCRQKLEKYLKF